MMPDTPQQLSILRGSAAARKVRKRFPPGTRVTTRNPATGAKGTVERHVPGSDAQGGHLKIRWDDGNVGRHPPISIEVLKEDVFLEEAAWLPDDVNLHPQDQLHRIAASGKYDLAFTKVPGGRGYGHTYSVAINPKLRPGVQKVELQNEWGGRPRTRFHDPAISHVVRHESGADVVRLKPDSGYSDELPDEEEPGHLWRGISHDEWENIKKTGRIKSNASMNFANQQTTTSFAPRSRTAGSYAAGFAAAQDKPKFDRPAYVIKITDPGTHTNKNADYERDIPGEIPASAIKAVYRGDVYSAQAGDAEIHNQGRTHWAMGSASMPSVNVGWKKIDHERELRGHLSERADELIVAVLVEGLMRPRLQMPHQ